MKQFLLAICLFALAGCEMYEYGTGTVETVELRDNGERSICTVRFRVGDTDTIYATRATPYDSDFRFTKCIAIREGDRVPIRIEASDTELDWQRL